MQDIKEHLRKTFEQSESTVELEEIEILEETDEEGNEGALILNMDNKYYLRYFVQFTDMEWFEIRDDDQEESPNGNGQE